MTTWLVLAALVAAVGAGMVASWTARRQRASARRRRAETLEDVARRVDVAVGSLDPLGSAHAGERSAPVHPAPVHPAAARDGVTGGGRAALVDAAAVEVAAARGAGSRLAAALVRTAPGTPVSAVADLVGTPAYVVGPDALAFLLPGLGRADALGVLARLEAHLAVSGRAAELEPGEGAAELVTRLLAPGTVPGSAPAGGRPRSRSERL